MAFLTVKLTKIMYAGSDIGNDLVFQFTANGKKTRIQQSVNHLDTIYPDKTVLRTSTSRSKFDVDIDIQVTEDDFVFSDVGWGSANFTIDTKKEGTHRHTAEVRVDEIFSDSAVFTFEFEVTVSANEIAYVTDVDPNGWLRVKLDGGLIHPLPNMLKVEVYRQSAEREYFIISEGRLRGKKASVKRPKPDSTSSYLSRTNPHRPQIQLVFDKASETLTAPGLAKSISTITDPSEPVPNGVYDLEIPYEPHDLGAFYETQSRYAITWFRIDTPRVKDRFLHPGSRSLGCTTVTDVTAWTDIYKLIIGARKDLRTVGTLKVT